MKLEDKIKVVKKTLGKEILIDKSHQVEVDVIKSGSIKLDRVLGCGGFPRGRITEVYGAEGSGKTTLCLHAMANAQRCLFVDTEQTFDWNYAQALGVDLDSLLISQPDTAEDALNLIVEMAECEDLDLIILDSVGALCPQVERDGEVGDSHVGVVARLMGQSMRKLAGTIKKSNIAVVFINQIRSNIATMGYGPKTTTTGGRALKFYASVRLEISRISQIKVKEDVIGARTRVKVMKNKLAPPFKNVEFDLIYGKGIQNELFEALLADGTINQAGAWFSIGDEKFQGKEAIQRYVEENKGKFLDKNNA